MAIKELATVPERFATGVGKTTVPNPGVSDTSVFSGDPAKFDFGKQTENYKALSRVLALMKKKFVYVGASAFVGRGSYLKPDTPAKLVSFVAVDSLTAPTFVWQKYEGQVAGGGQNYCYVGGVKIKTTVVLELAAANMGYVPKAIDFLTVFGRKATFWIESKKKLFYFIVPSTQGDEALAWAKKNFPKNTFKVEIGEGSGLTYIKTTL
jgi:hypothetical protein